MFLTGVGCIGKTTIGAELAAMLHVPFHDLDAVVERFFSNSIPRLQYECLTSHSYRRMAVEALTDLMRRIRGQDWVVALPPSGLMYPYGREVKNSGGWVVVLQADPEDVLARITFYDDDSNLIERRLSEQEKGLYLKEIKKDVTYFKRTYKSADLTVDTSGLDVRESAMAVKAALERAMQER
jgi:shikimate kinase